MPDVEVVDAAVGEAWCDVSSLLLLLEHERQEALDGRRRDVVPVRALDQRLRRHGRISFSSTGSVQLISERRTLPLRSRIARSEQGDML